MCIVLLQQDRLRSNMLLAPLHLIATVRHPGTGEDSDDESDEETIEALQAALGGLGRVSGDE